MRRVRSEGQHRTVACRNRRDPTVGSADPGDNGSLHNHKKMEQERMLNCINLAKVMQYLYISRCNRPSYLITPSLS